MKDSLVSWVGAFCPDISQWCSCPSFSKTLQFPFIRSPISSPFLCVFVFLFQSLAVAHLVSINKRWTTGVLTRDSFILERTLLSLLQTVLFINSAVCFQHSITVEMYLLKKYVVRHKRLYSSTARVTRGRRLQNSSLSILAKLVFNPLRWMKMLQS